MKSRFIAFIAAASLTLSSCMVVSGSRDATYKFRPSQIYTASKDVTFSVNFSNQHGEDGAYQPEAIVKLIQEKLMDTGLYRSVTYTPYTKSNNHYVFTIDVHGIGRGARSVLCFLHGLTLTTMPMWLTHDMEVRLDVENNGKKMSLATSLYARSYMWTPLLLAAPFANRNTASEKTVERFIAFFSNEIQARGMHL